MRTQELAASLAVPLTLAFIAAVIVAGLLIWPVVNGVRQRRRPPPDNAREVAWTAHDDNVSHAREPNEMPRDGRRRLPHEIAGFGTLSSRPRPDEPAPPTQSAQPPPADGGSTRESAPRPPE
ncbi:DUF6479 family protein [Streptodolium elevatio]|uniref:DUF6479 family protein n=1 Tax=Streptodolium elevatio TaxID=3157996 RepID=A0ABV3DN54_9ACTN